VARPGMPLFAAWMLRVCRMQAVDLTQEARLRARLTGEECNLGSLALESDARSRPEPLGTDAAAGMKASHSTTQAVKVSKSNTVNNTTRHFAPVARSEGYSCSPSSGSAPSCDAHFNA
jgi:DNA-binding transcriptional regulator LsrR (DeoR family)